MTQAYSQLGRHTEQMALTGKLIEKFPERAESLRLYLHAFDGNGFPLQRTRSLKRYGSSTRVATSLSSELLHAMIGPLQSMNYNA
ncbi:hypothetical protein [Pajaroellobacter abortibovis]|uniref:hypothetical protein n=1 Tax=Pajaroellobacter abortibovis TaxID=1882918 RepID=UPI0012EB6056|nr:hypothetical protein [Pajaroellobacter abortibovis]